MSADNGIFMAKFDDGYRVAHGFMSFVMDIDEETNIEKKKELLKYLFKNSKVYSDYNSAVEFATILSNEYSFLEYGIPFLGTYNFSLGEDKMEKQENKFWIVVNKTFPTKVSYAHRDKTKAIAEAKRLAKKEPGTEFVVMEAIESYVIHDLVRKIFVNEIPF